MTRKLLAVIAALALPAAAFAADTSPAAKDAKADTLKAEAKVQKAVGADTAAAKTNAKADATKASASTQKAAHKAKAKVKKAAPRRHHHLRPHTTNTTTRY